MAGARKFSIGEITRNEIFSANRETEEATKIPCITDKDDDIVKKILKS